jgi:hypothetical protein
MMSEVQLSDVQLTNLTLLLTIRDGLSQDPVTTCSKFNLSASEAERLSALSVQQIITIVANVGDATLFQARDDLIALLDSPLPLMRPLAAVQAAPRTSK